MPDHAADTRPEDAKTWKTVTDDEIDDYMEGVSHKSLHFWLHAPCRTTRKQVWWTYSSVSTDSATSKSRTRVRSLRFLAATLWHP